MTLDLPRALDVGHAGQGIAQFGHLGQTRWSAPVPAGPIRPAIAIGAVVRSEGNSQLVTITGPASHHGGIWDTLRTLAVTFVPGGSLGGINISGEISDSVWAVNGAGRNADLTGGHLWVNEGLLASQFATGFPAPGTAQDNTTLTYMNGYARSAIRQGAADFVIASNWPHSDFPDYDSAIQHAQWWRAHVELHNPGIPAWVFPAAYMVRDMRAYMALPENGGNEIYADPVHLNNTNHPEVIYALSHAAESFASKALPAGYGGFSTLQRDLFDLCWAVLQDYRWAGFGGTQAPADLLYLGAPLSESNDPVPSPALLPGEPTGTLPSFVTPPSITPATGTTGQVYTLDLGTYAGDAPITPTWSLTHSVDGDVTGDVVAGDYDSTGATAGTLTLSVSLSNAAGTAGPETDTATVSAAPTGPTRVFEITSAAYTGPTLTGTLPAVTSGYRTFTTGPAPVLGAALSLSGEAHVVAAVRIRNRTNNDIHVLSALHDGDPLATPHVYLIANDYVGGWLGVVATSAGNATIDGANFGDYSADTWVVVQEDVDLGTIRGAVDDVDGTSPVTDAAITAWATSQIAMFVSQAGNSITVDVAAFGVYDAALDATGRDAAWAWAQSYIPS